MMNSAGGPLAGLRILEIAGLGPAPFCGMLLADLGADVVVVDKVEAGSGDLQLGPAAIVNRGKRSIAVDLKSQDGVEMVRTLAGRCEALIEGMRPGVMERLGLGPDVCLGLNPRLVYGRMTGWGQEGPLAQAAGHDLNYIALSGALWYSGKPGQPPLAPPTLVGDLGGGALYLAVGVLAAVLNARETGRGQVVDAAIVDGSAHLMNLLLSLKGAGRFETQRGASLLDGPHWYATYRCADGRFVSLGSLEPKFYRQLCEKLGLADDPDFADGYDPANWADQRRRFETLFLERSQSDWCALLEGTDCCFAPVLEPERAVEHPHMAARDIYRTVDGVLQAAPAPRFLGTPAPDPGPIPAVGADRDSVVATWLEGRS